jgi:peptide/nickel transport system substrate-binding protein
MDSNDAWAIERRGGIQLPERGPGTGADGGSAAYLLPVTRFPGPPLPNHPMPRPTGAARTTRTAAAALLLALAAACRRDEPPARAAETARAEEGTPERGGTAVLAELGDVAAPMPLIMQSDLDGDLVDVLYMGLTRGAWRDGRMVYLTSTDSPMALAWRWEYVGADSAAIRFRMRSGVKWSDGRPVTAGDVVWTYAMMRDPAVASPRQQDVEGVDSVKAENDSTVVFHFRRRTPGMLFTTSIPIAPRHAFEAAGAAGLRTHPSLSDLSKLVVSGAFKVGARVPNQQLTLVPNPHFSRRPYLDRIVLRVVPEPTTRLVELQRGDVDMVRAIAFDQIPGLRKRAPNLRFAAVDDRYWEYVAYNPGAVPAFSDARVRRALGMAADVPGIVTALGMDEFTTPAAGPYPPIFHDLYDPARMKPLAYDTAGAKRLLDQAGWRDADGDGVREKDGKKLAFTLLTNSGNARRADVSQILQRQWQAVGADVRLRQLELTTFVNAQREKDFEALLGSWAVALSPDITPLFAPGSPLNIVSFRDSAATRLMAEAKTQPTEAAANPRWMAAAERIAGQQPYTWLYYYDVMAALGPRLRGVHVDTFGAMQNAWEWWIPKNQQGGRGAAPIDTAARDSAD